MGKIIGPLLNRIDLQVIVSRLKPEEMTTQKTGESSEPIRERVLNGREKAQTRFKQDNISSNAQMQSHHLREYCQLDDSSRNLIEGAIRKLGLSARAMDRILKVSRTIADLANEKNIQVNHLAEAIQYRTIDRM